MTENTSSWTLGTVCAALRKRWYVLIITALMGGVFGFAVSSMETPTFQSKATLFVSINHGSSGTDLNQGTTYAQNQMQSFAQLASSSRVLSPVIEDLQLDVTPQSLARNVEVITPGNTAILDIRATSESPDRAASIADAIALSVAATIEELSPSTAEGASSITAAVVDDAVVPLFQVSPNKPQDTVLSAAIGLILGAAAVLLHALFNTRIPNTDALKSTVSLPVLGSISRIPAGRKGVGLVVASDPLGRTSEEFRRVCSALTYASVSDPMRRILITSTSEAEGKSTFCANLALTLSMLRNRVLVIDADFRKPRLSEIFGVEGAVGLTTVLLGETPFQQAYIHREGTTLDILPSGSVPPNPSEVLTSGTMRDFIDEIAPFYDYIIIDSPPILSVADAGLSSPLVDGAILVVDAGKTRQNQLIQAVTSFETAGGRIVGAVLNKVRQKGADQYYIEPENQGSDQGARRRALR